jgi:hypothetical protein
MDSSEIIKVVRGLFPDKNIEFKEDDEGKILIFIGGFKLRCGSYLLSDKEVSTMEIIPGLFVFVLYRLLHCLRS